MPRRTRLAPTRLSNHHIDPSDPQLRTRIQLLTYAFTRVPTGQLPLLALYAYALVYLSDKGWIEPGKFGKAGASLLGVLSMVTGLLVSYRFSTALSKWDEGKKVWVEIRNEVRDGVRMLSIPPRSPATIDNIVGQDGKDEVKLDGEGGANTVNGEAQDQDFVQSADQLEEQGDRSSSSVKRDCKGKGKGKEVIDTRVNELSGLLVGFAFALKHHLEGTRPLPQPPLCDLLPPAYLSSLKRTEARVRFADTLSSSSSSSSDLPLANGYDDPLSPNFRPGLRRRSTGPPTEAERALADSEEDWELSRLREKAEEAVARLAEAVSGAGGGMGIGQGGEIELKQQLSQLNLPSGGTDGSPNGTGTTRSLPPTTTGQTQSSSGTSLHGNSAGAKLRSNMYSPYPPNLPLALLRLMEAYVVGLSEVGIEEGGWSDSKRERGLALVKDLSAGLANAERLSSNPPPLPLTIHLSHLLKIYLAALPASLLCVVSGWSAVTISVISGWCFLGLEALVSEVGGVFGQSENHHPLPRYANQILLESLDISPAFMRYYRHRLVARAGEEDESVQELDRRNKKGWGEEWMPSFD